MVGRLLPTQQRSGPASAVEGREMKRHDRSSNTRTSSGCHTVRTIQTVQPFPEIGLLADNSNLPLAILANRIRKVRGSGYSYVVSTVNLKPNAMGFEQHGSAPNFQGEVLTLCTCKHQMRSRLSADQWQDDVWIVGFTSRTIYAGKHWLFYLAKVESAHDSHSDLWSRVDASTRDAKAAHVHFLGDMFKPKTPQPTDNARFSTSWYVMPPIHAHRKDRSDTGWHNDINYYLASKSRHPPLLVADPKWTFLWEDPMIFFTGDHCRDYFKWSSLHELVARLREPR
jgi:hypothetical protein